MCPPTRRDGVPAGPTSATLAVPLDRCRERECGAENKWRTVWLLVRREIIRSTKE